MWRLFLVIYSMVKQRSISGGVGWCGHILVAKGEQVAIK